MVIRRIGAEIDLCQEQITWIARKPLLGSGFQHCQKTLVWQRFLADGNALIALFSAWASGQGTGAAAHGGPKAPQPHAQGAGLQAWRWLSGTVNKIAWRSERTAVPLQGTRPAPTKHEILFHSTGGSPLLRTQRTVPSPSTGALWSHSEAESGRCQPCCQPCPLLYSSSA